MDEVGMQAEALDASQTCTGDLFVNFQDLWGETRSEANRRSR